MDHHKQCRILIVLQPPRPLQRCYNPSLGLKDVEGLLFIKSLHDLDPLFMVHCQWQVSPLSAAVSGTPRPCASCHPEVSSFNESGDQGRETKGETVFVKKTVRRPGPLFEKKQNKNQQKGRRQTPNTSPLRQKRSRWHRAAARHSSTSGLFFLDHSAHRLAFFLLTPPTILVPYWIA